MVLCPNTRRKQSPLHTNKGFQDVVFFFYPSFEKGSFGSQGRFDEKMFPKCRHLRCKINCKTVNRAISIISICRISNLGIAELEE